MQRFATRKSKILILLAMLAANVALGVTIAREAQAQNSAKFVCLRHCKCLGAVCSELGDVGDGCTSDSGCGIQ